MSPSPARRAADPRPHRLPQDGEHLASGSALRCRGSDSRGIRGPRSRVRSSSRGPFSFDARAWREEIDAWRDEVLAAGLVPVLSHERLSRISALGRLRQSSRSPSGSRRSFLDARILIVVREQRSMILSNYHQYVRDGGACPLARYLPAAAAEHAAPARLRALSFFAVRPPNRDATARTSARRTCASLAYEQFASRLRTDSSSASGTLAGTAGRGLGAAGMRPPGTVVNSSALSPLTLGCASPE